MLPISSLIKAIIDQIVIAIPCRNYCAYNNIITYLEYKYGRCIYIDKDQGEYDWSGYYFDRRKIFFSFMQFKGWCFLVINDGKEMYNRIYRDIVKWRKNGWIYNSGKYKTHIYSIEVTFDFPTQFNTHEYAETVLSKLMQHIVPYYDSCRYKDICIGNGIMKCRDGAINGNYTTYWHSILRKSLDYLNPIKTSETIMDYKSYPKQIDSIWYFRFEIVFFSRGIMKEGFGFPIWYSQLEKKISVLKFDKFWKYIDVNYREFKEKYKELLKSNNLPPLTNADRSVLMYDRQPGRIYKMRQLVNKITGSNLPSTWRKKFIHNYTTDEMFKKIDDALSWN